MGSLARQAYTPASHPRGGAFEPVALENQAEGHLDAARGVGLAENPTEGGGSGPQVRGVEDDAVGAVEEFTAVSHLYFLGDAEALDDGEIHLLHFVLTQVVEARGEGAEIGGELLGGDAVELRDIEGTVRVMRIQIQRAAQVNDVAPIEGRAGGEGGDEIDVFGGFEKSATLAERQIVRATRDHAVRILGGDALFEPWIEVVQVQPSVERFGTLPSHRLRAAFLLTHHYRMKVIRHQRICTSTRLSSAWWSAAS